MERTLALKDRLLKHPLLKKENLNPKTWFNAEPVKGFTDLILQRDTTEPDTSFDNAVMCKLTCLSHQTHVTD